jgi:hypothetical protein
MAAITWRNVDAPNFGESARILGMAGDSFNNMFGVLNKQLEKHQAIGEQNWQNTANNNTDAFMGEMRRRYTTPEAYAAAQASGEVDALREQYGAQINVPAARELMYKMPENLQRQAVTQQAFAENRLHEKFKGTIAQALTQTMNGQGKEARTMLAESGMPPELQARTLADILATEQQGLRSTQQTEAHNALMASRKSEDAWRTAQTKSAGQPNKPDLGDITKMTDARKAPYQERLSNTAFGGDKFDSPKAAESILAMLTSTGTSPLSGSPAAFTQKLVAKLVGEGVATPDGKVLVSIGGKSIRVPLTEGLIKKAISDDDGSVTDPSVGGVAANLAAYLKSSQGREQAADYLSNKAVLSRIDQEMAAIAQGKSTGELPAFDMDDPLKYRQSLAKEKEAEAESERKVKQAQKVYSDPKTRQAAPFSFGF